MAADGDVDRDHGVGGPKRLLDVAVTLFDDHRLGGEPGFELAGLGIGRHYRGQFFEIGNDMLGGVLGLIGIFREHHRDRLAHIAYPAARHQRLTKGDEFLHAVIAEIDRRQVVNVGNGPRRNHARTGQGTGDVDGDDAPVRKRRAHHAHVELVRKRNVGREAPLTAHERRIFKPRDRGADDARRVVGRIFYFVGSHSLGLMLRSDSKVASRSMALDSERAAILR